MRYISCLTDSVRERVNSSDALLIHQLRGRWHTKHRRTRETRTRLLRLLDQHYYSVAYTAADPPPLLELLHTTGQQRLHHAGPWPHERQTPPTDRPPPARQQSSRLLDTTLLHIQQRLSSV